MNPTLNEMIDACERALFDLRDDRKMLNKKIVSNRQQQAELRNYLRKLRERKKAEKV